ATVGIFTGIFAKEAVVGTLNSLYATIDHAATGTGMKTEEGGAFSFMDAVRRAFVSIPANLRSLAESALDPLGLSAVSGSATAVTADQGVSSATLRAMVRHFDGKAGAFAYMLFILLYFPCVAAFGAMVREIGLRWALLAGAWSSWLAWFAAVEFYQGATFMRHPEQSAAWMLSLVALMVAVIAFMKHYGDTHAPPALAAGR
ncbi:MAG TPA: ferrous iron transporter B, partial [Bryobacterales bacterium]|nr:ferrous iron transporter B [Bryobacterales bacterium]